MKATPWGKTDILKGGITPLCRIGLKILLQTGEISVGLRVGNSQETKKENH